MKTVMTLCSVAALVAAASFSLSAAERCYQGQPQSQTLTLEAGSVSMLDIEAGAGTMTVEGVSGSHIEVVGKLHVGDPDSYRFELLKKGSKAVLKAYIEEGGSCSGSESPFIDIAIRVPRSLDLEISDGSGDINVSNIGGELSVADGSGHIRIADVDGEVSVDDGSGNIELANIGAEVEVNDGSGHIVINGVNAGVEINDGSGNIDLQRIQRFAEINDGSGHIRISDLTAGSARSPKIEINDGSGDIEINRAEAWVSVSDGSGDIEVNSAKGLTIEGDGSGDVRVSDTDYQQDSNYLM
ncbi:DUF4097 family beta strand repeat-containing protein [Ferrimonas aestuarii]|uniref:DUF4097 domain-containing protein n=1 Tax=Ferrimonas aestuarii TaxID=2569539 RepID=A0A4U1BNN5_9GAMM|nr:DUF4097 family beta strand repeat-containing protein [Ferrimonas aestuarii]TKB54770.1 DUF4097 domain-containing protein [Ferrimonas aestuarii]